MSTINQLTKEVDQMNIIQKKLYLNQVNKIRFTTKNKLSKKITEELARYIKSTI